MKDTIYKLNIPLRTALLADLHDRPFGWITRSLIAHKPDIICIAGDTAHRFDFSDDRLAIQQTRYVLPFLKACSEIAPTFMSLGNHEWRLCEEDIALLGETGATVLENSYCSFGSVLIGGLSSAGYTAYKKHRRHSAERYPEWHHGDCPHSFAPERSWLDDFCAREGYKILLCHHPEYRDKYLSSLPIDLVLSGHAHGGQIRLFGHGLYAPGQGILPEYTSGIHGNMVISTGLANTAGMIPRLFNPREIVYIEPMEQPYKTRRD